MKNSKYFPFERNRYFYGKLLSVNDFDLEQKYNNDKRRVMNRFVYGMGIVNGLYVVPIDEESVSVEMGIALDALGREIVVDTPVIKKLNLIEGYDMCMQSENLKYMYLCIDYAEKEVDPVQSVANNISFGNNRNDVQYNKTQETYQLHLTNMEPKSQNLSVMKYFEDIRQIYRQKGVSIKMVTPKYAHSGGRIEIRMIVENLERSNLSFSFDLHLAGLKYEEKDVLHVTFDEHLHEKNERYEITYMLDAADVKQTEGSLKLDTDSMVLTVFGENQATPVEALEAAVLITQDNIAQNIIDDYYHSEMNRIDKDESSNTIYLAKIYVDQVGQQCTIRKAENVPFYQYVMNNMLAQCIHQMTEHNTDQGYSRLNSNGRGREEQNGTEGSGLKIKQGVIRIPLDARSTRHEVIYSKDISHGLGVGNVAITLGIEKVDSTVIYGDSGLFEHNGADAELAAQVNPKTGTFVIGARIRNATQQQELVIHWTAVKDMKENVQEMGERRILIKPSILELKIRESHNLEAVCKQMNDKTVRWSVKEGGGAIDSNGLYTAPNEPGVYEVVAESVAFPEVKASIFVLVRK